MKLRFLLLAVAGLGMLACAKDGAEGPAVPDGSKSIVLKIALPQTTRAFTPDDPYVEKNTTISKIDVYFTDNNGIIQEVYSLTGQNLDAIKSPGPGLRFTGLENVARVYCVANCAGVIGKGNSIKSFTKKLSEQKPDMDQNASIFVGYDADITPFVADTNEPEVPNYDTGSNAPGEGDQAYKAAVTIRPLISRIEWGKITIEESGHKVIYDNQTPAQPKYLIAWKGWKPALIGVYQSNVYLTSKIFADANTNIVDNHFATIDKDNDIVNGAWKKDTDGATLAYSDYSNPTGPYNPLIADLANYNTSGKCIPFHFFVPFDATATSADNDNDNDVNTTEKFEADKKPLWHFQLQYDEKSSYQYTVYRYKGENLGDYDDTDKVTDPDEVLSVSVDFIYPGNADNIAYVNVLKLLKGTDEIIYQPGKIYKADITLSPFNVSGSYTEVIDYNVIVNVSVADFESETVTPGFN